MSKLIDQGGFGCIFYPGFNCKGEIKTKKVITKLQVDNFTARNEILIGSIIKKILHYSLYFLPVLHYCPISVASLDTKKFAKCKILSDKDNKYLLFELPYIKHISFKQVFSQSLRNTKHLFLTFIETFQYITISIEYLVEKNIIHFDLKENNILYSVKYDNPILIDFGLSIPMGKFNISNSKEFKEFKDSKQFKEYFYIYSPDYYIWPLEVHVINFLVNVKDKLLFSDIEKLVEIYVSNNSGLKIFSDSFKQQYKLMCIEFLKKYENIPGDIVIKELIQYYKTWDQYSLSILYLKFYKIIFINGFFESKFILNFSQLLLTNISPVPNKRLSLYDTLQKYKDIFFINEKPENYLTLINNLKF